MANLGTLWFGADIDLARLQQKINQGNQSLLNALKMNYDPQSYQEMVNRLRSNLARETFEIKIQADTRRVVQNIQNATKVPQVGQLPSMDALNEKIARQKALVNALTETVERHRIAWQRLGGNDRKNTFLDSKKELAMEKRALADLVSRREAMRHTAQDSILSLRKEAAEHRNAARAAAEAAKQKREAIRQTNADHIRLNQTLAGGIHISTQLGSALSSLFAVHAARQFLGNVIEIGGQLERQRISIGAILGDTVKASHLFEQIKGLALKSPFGVVELDQYTKQLSAYGFRYNELFDMTKRLADISAGAGTDIGRLTLALGHVRSATYLTGITLRQFSMNNIPMLKMLADYYSEVEKKAVSTAEVQKRISKRQVSYEDVIEQIRRLTDEGGMFYNMQEKISESLSAKFKNLKDAMDIMYGEMAEGGIGDILKDTAAGLLQLTRHWKEIAAVMSVAATAFLLNKSYIGLNAIAMQGNTAATLKQIMADKKLAANQLQAASRYRALTAEERIRVMSANTLTAANLRQALVSGKLTKDDLLRLVALKKINIAQAMHIVGVNGITAAEIRAAAAAKRWKVALDSVRMSLKNAFMGMGVGTWATLGAMVGMEIYTAYSSWVERIEGKANEMKDLIKSRIVDLEKLQKSLNAEGKPKDDVGLKNRVADMKQVLANSEVYTKTLDDQLRKAGSMSAQYDILSKTIGDIAEKNRKALDYQDRAAEMIKASSFLHPGDKWDNMVWGWADSIVNDDIGENLSQAMDAYKNLRATIDGLWEYREALKSVIEEMVASGEVSEDFKRQLDGASLEEQIRILADSDYWEKIVAKVTGLKPTFADFADDLKESSDSVTRRWEEIADDDIPRMMEKAAKDMNMSEKDLREWANTNVDDFKMMLEGILDQLDAKEPWIRKQLKRIAYDYVTFGKIDRAIIEGEQVGRSIFGDDDVLKKLLDEDEKADIKDDAPGADKGKDKNKKDTALEAAKTKLAEYKAFLSEYKKYRERYDKESAINLLEKLFPSLKGQGARLVDDYTNMLDELRNSLPATTEARKKFINEVDKTKTDTLFDRETEALKRNVSVMEDYIKKMEDQWKLYRKLLEKSGGNRDFASMAFRTGEIWDESAKALLQRFNERGNELGVMPMKFSWDMSEEEMKDALRDAKGVTQEELVKLAQEIQKIIRGNYTQFLEDSAEAYNKALTAVDKLMELERQRDDLAKRRRQDNSGDPNIAKGYEAQMAALDKQIANQRWEAFKESEEWGRIFSNLDDLSTSTLRNMLDRLREFAPTIKDSVEATKALYEAMDKIEDMVSSRNPFAAMGNALMRSSQIRKLMNNGLSDYGYRNANGKYTIGAQNARKLGLNVRKNGEYSDNDLQDGLRRAESDFVTGLNGMAEKFKAVQDVLQPVIDLFDELGNEGLSTLFSMGSNAFGSAVQVAGGLNTLGLGSLGPYGAAAAAALSVTTSLFALHDKSIEAEIEASERRQKEMETLSKNLETALKRSLGGAYGFKMNGDQMSKLNGATKASDALDYLFGAGYMSKGTKQAINDAKASRSYYDATYASLMAQRDEAQHQLDLESKKKKQNADKMADYEQEIAELDDQIKNFAADMANALYGIDFKAWSEDLAGALVDAWAAGESGAEAYRQKVSEILRDLGTKMIAERFIANAIEPIMDEFLKQYEQDDGVLTEKGLGIIAKMYDAGDEMERRTNAFMDGLNEIARQRGAELRDEESGSGSTSSGIKSITESTADLLASYINAIRADVSVNRMVMSTTLPSIATAVERVNVLAEQQVSYQQQIAQNTLRNAEAAEMIYNILHRVENGVTRLNVK